MTTQQPPTVELSPEVRAQIAQAVQPLVPQLQRQMVESLRNHVEQQSPPQSGVETTQPESGAETTQPESAAPGAGSQLIKSVGAALPGVLKQEAGQPLRDAVSSALDILFDDRVRETLQHQAEKALGGFLLGILETIDDEAARRELQQQTEKEFSRIIGETLEVLFTGACREQLKQHLERAVDRAFDGDTEGALQDVKDGALGLVPGIVEVLDDHWEQILPLLFRAAFQSLREAIEPSFKGGLMDLAVPEKENVEGQADELAGTMKDKAEEVQGELTEAAEEVQARLRGLKERLRKNIKEGVQSAVKSERSGPGRPPSGRPPRPPSGRPPKAASRPPGGRPPGARRQRSTPSTSGNGRHQ